MRNLLLICVVFTPSIANAQSNWQLSTETPGDKMLVEYFRTETQRITESCLADVKTADDWQAVQEKYRGKLADMLGLNPFPDKGDLNPKVTSSIEHDGVVVDNIQFQSLPGLYVTGNLYRPKNNKEKLPAVLYVCGHGRVKKDGISYGNKTHYHHHGVWFARNGYVCLVIDTIQLGEIEGMHHGTYRHGKWWWHSRGYTPAGVEAWNGMRSLDYLQSRDDVDGERLGITGRSGGGAYSWWVAALDTRVKAAVPVAGIASLKNHVVDGCVEGHCDCMYHVNTYEWDFPQIAALVAPRALLISNTDKDRIFPLDGVVDVYQKTRRIYELMGAKDRIGLHITEGPHKDTQELRVHAFRWLNRFLKEDDELISITATKEFEPAQLKVFEAIPKDEIVTTIDDDFTQKAAAPTAINNAQQWNQTSDRWLTQLQTKSFAGWPDDVGELKSKLKFDHTNDGIRFAAWDFESQAPFQLRCYVAHPAATKPEDLDLVVLNVIDESEWTDFVKMMNVKFSDQLSDTGIKDASPDEFQQTKEMFSSFKWGMAWVAPRGVGLTKWSGNEKRLIQIRRRFALLGQTIEGQQVWDARRAIQFVQKTMPQTPLWLQGNGQMAAISLYASLFEKNVSRIDLHDLPSSHRQGPHFLNVLRTLDIPQAVALAAEHSRVRIYGKANQDWAWPIATDKTLGWNHIQFREIQTDANK